MRQRGIYLLCGAACFCLGLAKLSLQLQAGLSSLFVVVWLTVMGLFLIANLNDLMRQVRIRQRRKEAERRRQWLEAEQRWRRRQRLTVHHQ